MKTTIGPIIAFLSFLGSLSAGEYIWNPGFFETELNKGGDAIWNGSNKLWWNSQSSEQYKNVAETFFSGEEDGLTLYFKNVGNITKQGASGFGNGSFTFDFAAGSTYNFTSADNTSSLSANNASFFFKVGSGATLNFSAGTGSSFMVYTGNAGTGSTNIGFQGGGTINFNANAYIQNRRGNGGTVISGGTTVNFNAGSLFTGAGGSLSTPNANTNISRISIDGGILNLNGGTIITGAAGTSNNAGRGYGIQIGSSNNASALNIYSGELIALGEARGTSATDPKTTYAGVVIGNSSAAATSGGTLNLYGGTLVTSHIQTVSTVKNAILNLDGGTIVVSTDIAPGTGTAHTNAQLENRLNNFIAGFADTATNRVIIGANGITFDTSRIDTTRTHGTATIKSNLHGTGSLTKIGANSLRLVGTNTYTGETHVNAGRLINEGRIAGKTNVALNAILAGNGTFADIDFTGNIGTLEAAAGLRAGAVTFLDTLNISIDLSNISDSQEVLIAFDSLHASGSTVSITLSGVDTSMQGYSLLQIGATNLNSSNFVIHNDEGLGWEFNAGTGMLSIGAIPEPSTYTLILGLLALTLITSRRKIRR